MGGGFRANCCKDGSRVKYGDIMKLYVHYGCHWCASEEWLNFDASPTLRLERLPVVGRMVRKNARRFPSNVLYGDIVRGLPVKENSCDGVYCSHVLEHLALEDCRRALLNTHRMMKKRGGYSGWYCQTLSNASKIM